MSEVHRYYAVKLRTKDGNIITCAPHGQAMVLASDFDALQQRCRDLENERDAWKSECAEAHALHATSMRELGKILGEDVSDEPRHKWVSLAAASVAKERDALRAEVERFKGGLGIAQRHRDELLAEVEALRKDAERLQWVLNEECHVHGYLAQGGVRYGVVWTDLGEQQAELFVAPRDAIDAAMEAAQ